MGVVKTFSENETAPYLKRKGIPLNVTLYAWPIPKFDIKHKNVNDTNYFIDKNSESAKNYTNSLHNLNATGYVAIEDDLNDTGLSDVQTFILAGVATVIPLLVIVIAILGIRFLWRKYRVKKEEGYEGVLQKEESSEPLGKLHTSYSFPQELKTTESQFTVTEEENPSSSPSTQMPTSKSNGSVITMTLKNNHLIVETEETTSTSEGIKIESKGTFTKFVTFKTGDIKLESKSSVCTSSNLSSNHGALIHSAPQEAEDELERANFNTGFSQSDLSVSSTESQNPCYRYGNQMGYDSGSYGYPEYAGYSANTDRGTNLILTKSKSQKLYLRGSSITEAILNNFQSDNTQLKDVLMSDIQAREKRESDKNLASENALSKGDSDVQHPMSDSSAEEVIVLKPNELQLNYSKEDNAQLNNNLENEKHCKKSRKS